MILPAYPPIRTQSSPDRNLAKVHPPQMPPWFHSFRMAKELDPSLKFDPSDIFYSTELRCPNCNQFSADSICSCGATIQHPDTGELP